MIQLKIECNANTSVPFQNVSSITINELRLEDGDTRKTSNRSGIKNVKDIASTLDPLVLSLSQVFLNKLSKHPPAYWELSNYLRSEIHPEVMNLPSYFSDDYMDACLNCEK